MDRQERIAIIGHELAHELNGDPGRSVLIDNAEQTLWSWHDMLYDEERARVDASHPPTAYRIRFLQAHAGLAAEFDDGRVDWDAIDAELAAFHEGAGVWLLENAHGV